MVRIAIVGAGVGGLSLARALSRLDVQNVTVFDRRPSPSPQIDRGLGLWDDSQVGFKSLLQSTVSISEQNYNLLQMFAVLPQSSRRPDRHHWIQYTSGRLPKPARHVAVPVLPDPRESLQGAVRVAE